jgi:4-hydroxybenzoate polyprenyltransferase
MLFVQLWLLFGAVYSLNQIFDVESDRANRKLFFLPENLISHRAAWVFTIGLNVAALVLAALLGGIYWLMTAAIASLGVLYSVGGCPWKNRPFLGFFANVVAHGVIVFALGLVFAQGSFSASWVAAIPYGLAVGGVYLATAAADVDGDRLTGKKTLAVICGETTTMRIALVLVVAALLMALRRSDWYLAASAIASLPFFILAAVTPWRHQHHLLRALSAPQAAAKVAVAALTIAAIVAYPFYLACLVPGFIATRAFFRWRFKMTYPSLSPGS